MTGHVLNFTEFEINNTGFFSNNVCHKYDWTALNKTYFVLNMTGFVLIMTGFVLNLP